MTLTHLERLFAALYVSEVWYALWTSPYARLYHKARAMVVYDRVLTGRLDPHAEGSSSASWYGRSQPVCWRTSAPHPPRPRLTATSRTSNLLNGRTECYNTSSHRPD